jgi:hypothetical protein
MHYSPCGRRDEEMAMREVETPATGRAETARTGAGPPVGLFALGLLGAGAYAAHAWLPDSPYWMELGHRPLVVVLRAAAQAVDWAQGVKTVVILASSVFVLRTPARRLPCTLSAPRLSAAAPAMEFGLEFVR